MKDVLTAVLLTAIAGLSTGIGGLTVFCSRNMNKKFLAFTLGISAGVMIYISFVELFANAGEGLCGIYGEKSGTVINTIAFFCGIGFVALVDRMIPDGSVGTGNKPDKLLRTGMLTAVALSVHNFPEGMATFVSALQSPNLAIPIVAAIAIHNIPEGIAVAVPIYYGTRNKGKAFLYSLLSGLTEPLGAIVGYIILMPFMTDTVNWIVFSVVAGIMVFISVDELLPAAQEYGEHNLSVAGLVTGMIVMAVSLIGFM